MLDRSRGVTRPYGHALWRRDKSRMPTSADVRLSRSNITTTPYNNLAILLIATYLIINRRGRYGERRLYCLPWVCSIWRSGWKWDIRLPIFETHKLAPCGICFGGKRLKHQTREKFVIWCIRIVVNDLIKGRRFAGLRPSPLIIFVGESFCDW